MLNDPTLGDMILDISQNAKTDDQFIKGYHIVFIS